MLDKSLQVLLGYILKGAVADNLANDLLSLLDVFDDFLEGCTDLFLPAILVL